MTNDQAKDLERDMPKVNLRNAILDAVDAHKRGSYFDATFIERCRDQLTDIYEDLTKGETA